MKEGYVYLGDEELAARYGRGLTPELPRYVWEDRIDRCKKLIEKKGLNALLVYSGGSRERGGREWTRYFANVVTITPAFSCDSLILIPVESDPVLFINWPTTVPLIKEMSLIEDVRPFVSQFGGPAFNVDSVRDSLKEKRLENGRIGLAVCGCGGTNYIPAALERCIMETLSTMSVEYASDILYDLIEIKTDYDIKMMRKTGQIVCECLKVALETVGEGVREIEIALAFEKAAYERGCEMMEQGDARVSVRSVHGRDWFTRGFTKPFYATNRKFEKGDSLGIDVGLVYMGYQADIFRVAIIGEPSKEQIELHECGMNMHRAGRDALKHGVKVQEVGEIILRELKRYKNTICLPVLIHGTGFLMNEPPMLFENVPNPAVFKKGMITTLETCVFNPSDRAGTEDHYLITDGEPEWLTPLSQELYVA